MVVWGESGKGVGCGSELGFGKGRSWQNQELMVPFLSTC